MRYRKIREESGVLVPTSGEQYCDSSGENGSQAAPWHTSPQILISANPSRLHQGWFMVQLLALLDKLIHVCTYILSKDSRAFAVDQKQTWCKAWTARQILFGLWSERSVFVLDEQKTDLLPVSLTRFLSSNQTCLVHPECGCGSILEFRLRLVSQYLENVWQAWGFD